MSSKVLLCNSNECTGCFACEGACPKGAIVQIVDSEGFRHPIIEVERCVGCHICEKVCPVLNPIIKYQRGRVYAAWSLNDEIRLTSSSGGIFSELALCILNQGGIVVGASMNNSGYVRHTIASTKEELLEQRGSKYVQSLLGREIYRSIIEQIKKGKKVLFSGCPCQVAGMRSLIPNNENLLLIDVVCHGVPSPDLFADVYKRVKAKHPSIGAYFFRQMNTWGGCLTPNYSIIGSSNTKPLTGNVTFYQDAFMKGYTQRINCYNCMYSSVQRVGDITLADFWGIGRRKEITEDYKSGCSFVSVNSKKGSFLFDSIKNNIYYEERDVQETIDGGNDQLLNPIHLPIERATFYEDYKRFSTKKLIKKYRLKILKNKSLFDRVYLRIRHILNTY